MTTAVLVTPTAPNSLTWQTPSSRRGEVMINLRSKCLPGKMEEEEGYSGEICVNECVTYPQLEHQRVYVSFRGLSRCRTPGCISQIPPAACIFSAAGSASQRHPRSHCCGASVLFPGPSLPDWWGASVLAVWPSVERFSQLIFANQYGLCWW